jgi:hypothetical protein
MITLNGRQYELCLLDTNVISEIVKHPNQVFRKFLEIFEPGKFIPCFSLFSVLELRQKPEIYNLFLELYSIYPCIFLKNIDQLFEDELNAYPNPNEVSPILIASIGELAKPNEKFKDILKLTFSNSKILENENRWNKSKSEILESMLNYVKNYPPKQNKYTQKEIRLFLDIVGFEQIALRAPRFANEIIRNGQIVSIDAFPSIKMIAYTTFFKFYTDQRQPILSDPFDIIISSALPYVDAVITESHQAEVIKKIQKLDGFINRVEIHKLKEINI